MRVPAREPWLVKRALDAGARTLMFPCIETLDDATHAVRLTRYPSPDSPDGLRGVAGMVRAAAFGMRRDYVQTANAQVAVIVQIESARGVDEVERIAALPGIDCLFVGPADLAASLGTLATSVTRTSKPRWRACSRPAGRPASRSASSRATRRPRASIARPATG